MGDKLIYYYKDSEHDLSEAPENIQRAYKLLIAAEAEQTRQTSALQLTNVGIQALHQMIITSLGLGEAEENKQES